jgi:hypothetical protein
MWPDDHVVKYNVRASYKRSASWGYWAGIKGLPVPVFLALAADEYTRHLELVHARIERARERRKARETQEAER